jgi:DNA-binding MarR family transcriptional regulator
MDDISGTYGLTAAADSFLVLRKQGSGGTLHAGGRLWDRDDSDFELSRKDQRWHLIGVSDGLSSGERFTLKVISESGGMTPTQLAKVLDCTRQNAYQRLDALLAKGKVEKREGVYFSLTTTT